MPELCRLHEGVTIPPMASHKPPATDAQSIVNERLDFISRSSDGLAAVAMTPAKNRRPNAHVLLSARAAVRVESSDPDAPYIRAMTNAELAHGSRAYRKIKLYCRSEGSA